MQEVLDLPVLNLAAVQSEDPDLVFIKELLREHDVRPPWNAVREESAEVKILWSRRMSYTAGEKKQHPTPDGKWWLLYPYDPRSLKSATPTPWLLIREW